MLEKIANIFKIPDLRKRVLFTLGMLAVYRLGSHIPTPGINADMLAQFFNQNSGSALGLVDLFSGGNLRKLTVFALGIMPYITASIIFQLLTVIYEPLAKLQKEGELGRRKITQWTRYVTVLLGIVQSFAIALTLTNTSTGQSMVPPPNVTSGGVMSVMFASSILSALLLFGSAHVFGYSLQDSAFFQPIFRAIAPGEPWYEVLSVVAIIFFAYFYSPVVFRP